MKKTPKPRIIVLSKDTETDSFRWVSDGWYEAKLAGSPKAEALMKKAHKCIVEGSDVKDVIARLKKAGFSIKRR